MLLFGTVVVLDVNAQDNKPPKETTTDKDKKAKDEKTKDEKTTDEKTKDKKDKTTKEGKTKDDTKVKKDDKGKSTASNNDKQTATNVTEEEEEDDSKVKKEKKPNVKKFIKLANKSFNKGNFYGAVDHLEEAMVLDPENVVVAYKLGDAYFASRDYKNAEKYYTIVEKNGLKEYPWSTYLRAKMMKMNGKYQEAEKLLTFFAKKYRGTDSRVYRKLAKVEAKGCIMAMKLMKSPLPMEITHLGATVNSPYSDFAPYPLGDTALLYASLPLDTAPSVRNKKDDTLRFKIYRSVVKGMEYSQGVEISDLYNDPEFHTANAQYSPDRKRFYFTKCTSAGKKGAPIICNIFVSILSDTGWLEPVALGDEINGTKHTSTQPTVGPYKRGTEILYFVSNKAGGKGGMDIWYSTITKKGQYKTPRNLRKLNSVGDDMTPFYDSKNGIMYFSSNGRESFGGHDIYKSRGAGSRYSTPENMGFPLNGPTDDLFFSVTESEDNGYFVSNRPGIFALKSETCCHDVFRYDWIRRIKLAVTGNVYVERKGQLIPIDKPTVSLYLADQGKTELRMESDTIRKKELYIIDLTVDRDYNHLYL